MVQNRRFVLASRPANAPSVDNFRLESNEVDLSGAKLADNEILVKTLYLSLDPYLRAPMGLPGDKAKPAAFSRNQFKDASGITGIGELFGGRGAGVVLKSKNPKIQEGDLVAADWKWEEYATFNPDTELTFEKLDKDTFTTGKESGKIPLSTALGSLGVSGSHAYFGYHHLQPKPTDTIVVSSAGGNIGVVVSQLAKVDGLRTVGIAGGSKAAELEIRGICDKGIDYRAFNNDANALSKALQAACPKGIDVYFDCARGFISDAVFENLNPDARVYICGGVSQYNNGSRLNPYGDAPSKEGVKVDTGMALSQKYLANIPEARDALVKLILAGKLSYIEHVTVGFENVPKAFVGMYSGENFGKALVQL